MWVFTYGFSLGDLFLHASQQKESPEKKRLALRALREFEKAAIKAKEKNKPIQYAKLSWKCAICYLTIAEVEDSIYNLKKGLEKIDEASKIFHSEKISETKLKIQFYKAWIECLIGDAVGDDSRVRTTLGLQTATLQQLDLIQKPSKHIDLIMKHSIAMSYFFSKSNDTEWGLKTIDLIKKWVHYPEILRESAYYAILNEIIALCLIQLSGIENQLSNLKDALIYLDNILNVLNEKNIPIILHTHLRKAHIQLMLANYENRESNIDAAIISFDKALSKSIAMNMIENTQAIQRDIIRAKRFRMSGAQNPNDEYETKKRIKSYDKSTVSKQISTIK